MTPIIQKNYAAPATDRRELLRYASARAEEASITVLADSVIAEASPHLTYRLAYRELTVYELGDAGLAHPAILERLADAGSVIVVAATVGLALDRLIARAEVHSPSRALMLDALGAERVEALLDTFSEELVSGGYSILPRFSPGYGKIPLEIQKNIFSSKQIYI